MELLLSCVSDLGRLPGSLAFNAKMGSQDIDQFTEDYIFFTSARAFPYLACCQYLIGQRC